MRAQILDYIETVQGSLGDPSFSKRITTARLLRELEVAHSRVYESMLKVSGMESRLGYTESTITVEDDKEFYKLPGNFRQFIGLQKRINDNPNNVSRVYGSIPSWDTGPGIVINSAQRGFQIRPVPVLNDDETYVLQYQAGPVILHYGTAQSVDTKHIKLASSVAAAAGEIITEDDYYNGSLIGIVSADTGVGQVNECVDFDGTSRMAEMRHDWSPLPTGTITYEIRPVLPRPFHKLIALTAAITFAGERRDYDGRRVLISEWRELFRDAKNYFATTTQDRAPILQNLAPGEDDPYAH